MKLTYIGGHDAVVVPLPYGGEVEVAQGGIVEVPDSLGERLLEQESNWQPVAATKKPEKPADGGDD